MPFHGDHKRLRLHAQLAESVGIESDRIFKGRNGLALEIDSSGARLGPEVPSGMIFVDGVDIGDPDDVALRDRRALSADGVFIVVATISSDDGSQVAPPEIMFRGVPFLDEADGLVDELRDVVARSLEDAARHQEREASLLQEDLHDDIAGFVYERLRRRPMVLPVIVEV
jgi:ribonuclease J